MAAINLRIKYVGLDKFKIASSNESLVKLYKNSIKITIIKNKREVIITVFVKEKSLNLCIILFQFLVVLMSVMITFRFDL